MGIVRLGHQKKILLAIKRVKDIRAGKRSISNQGSLDFTRIQPGQVGAERELINETGVCSDVLEIRISRLRVKFENKRKINIHFRYLEVISRK